MAEKRPDCDWCGAPSHAQMSRREFLYVGLIGGIGLTLGDFLGQRARAAMKQFPTWDGPAESVIHIFLPGGLSAQESFDPKPHAPVEYRGPFGTIKTKLDGVRFSENLPETAKIADRLSIIRSMTHGEAAHQRGTHNMFTGYAPSPAIQYPSMGSVVAHQFGGRNDLPPYVSVPNKPNEYAGSGYLSARYGPFSLGADPAADGFQVRDLNLPDGVGRPRFDRRRNMLESVDQHFRSLEQSDALDAMDSFYQQAYGMLSSKEAREAFDLSAEPKKLREAYGRNRAGQRMLMARRLAESGARFVSMTYGGWDHHRNLQSGIGKLMPEFDQAFATLIRDLERRGQLEKTLVLVTSEFGRTPKINDNAGRDHWPKVFSIAMAGGGIRKGYVHGASDPTGVEPADKAVGVPDYAMTVYNQLGLNGEQEIMSPGGRPVEIVKGGQVIEDLVERDGRSKSA